MTGEQRRSVMERALAELLRGEQTWILFADAGAGDNYVEVAADMRAEVTHRRWPGSKLPALSPEALSRLDRLGFRETERNLVQSFAGWALPRIAKHLEQVFVDCYGCDPAFELRVSRG